MFSFFILNINLYCKIHFTDIPYELIVLPHNIIFLLDKPKCLYLNKNSYHITNKILSLNDLKNKGRHFCEIKTFNNHSIHVKRIFKQFFVLFNLNQINFGNILLIQPLISKIAAKIVKISQKCCYGIEIRHFWDNLT